MKKLATFSLMLVLPLLLGCGGARLPGLVPAAGTVTLNGEPIEGVTIIFTPLSPSGDARTATAVSDAGGKFVVSTLDPNDGIKPGHYKISFSKKTGVDDGNASASGDERRGGRDSRQTINHLPAKYSGSASDLSVSIPSSGNKSIELNLEGEVDLSPQSPARR
jgi:hypothetical protein